MEQCSSGVPRTILSHLDQSIDRSINHERGMRQAWYSQLKGLAQEAANYALKGQVGE